MSYTYDGLCRVCNRRTADLNTGVTDERFSYDAASNVLDDDCVYDTHNRLTSFKGESITYDADGNMTCSFLNDQSVNLTFDSRNRLISDGIHTYTYNAENTRIRSTCNGVETSCTYNTNAKLNQLLVKRTTGVITKYVYGLGLIGEEKYGEFKTYHFDYRGSTVAITNAAGAVTDTFAYDTYGKLTGRTGSTDTPFLYNGRDGVMTEKSGLYYMRARYYSPEMRRFVNADIVSGEITNAITLNRYAYANGNPVSNIDPFGLSAERGAVYYKGEMYAIHVPNHMITTIEAKWETVDSIIEYDLNFDFVEFLTGIQFDDANGLLNGTNSDMYANASKSQFLTAGAHSITSGLLNSAYNSLDTIFLEFRFQKSGNQKRVIISVGSSKTKEFNNRYAGTTIGTFGNAGPFVKQVLANGYETLTGESAKWYETYDIQITWDKRHKDSPYRSYLWIDSDGTFMETPILYENDKAGFVKGTNIIGFCFDYSTVAELPINTPTPVSADYQKLFTDYIKKL